MHKRLASLTEKGLRGAERGVVGPSISRSFRGAPLRPKVFTDNTCAFPSVRLLQGGLDSAHLKDNRVRRLFPFLPDALSHVAVVGGCSPKEMTQETVTFFWTRPVLSGEAQFCDDVAVNFLVIKQKRRKRKRFS